MNLKLFVSGTLFLLLSACSPYRSPEACIDTFHQAIIDSDMKQALSCFDTAFRQRLGDRFDQTAFLARLQTRYPGLRRGQIVQREEVSRSRVQIRWKLKRKESGLYYELRLRDEGWKISKVTPF